MKNFGACKNQVIHLIAIKNNDYFNKIFIYIMDNLPKIRVIFDIENNNRKNIIIKI